VSAIRVAEAEERARRTRLEHDVFSERFLIKRPSLRHSSRILPGRRTVDRRADRADEAFEAFRSRCSRFPGHQPSSAP